MTKASVGLLPLYIELYDNSWPEMRTRVDGFYQQIASALTDRGLEVDTVPVCRLKPEFESAIRQFEGKQVDAIVTLHLAYSPSLESSWLPWPPHVCLWWFWIPRPLTPTGRGKIRRNSSTTMGSMGSKTCVTCFSGIRSLSWWRQGTGKNPTCSIVWPRLLGRRAWRVL